MLPRELPGQDLFHLQHRLEQIGRDPSSVRTICDVRRFEYYVSPLDAAEVSAHLAHPIADSLAHQMSHSDLVLGLLLIQLLDIREGLGNIILDNQIC